MILNSSEVDSKEFNRLTRIHSITKQGKCASSEKSGAEEFVSQFMITLGLKKSSPTNFQQQ